MNPLQISLIAIAIVVVVAIVLYNRLQERKYRQQAREMFAPQPSSEPEAESVAASQRQPEAASNAMRIEPVLEAQPDRPTPHSHPVSPPADTVPSAREKPVASIEKTAFRMSSTANKTTTQEPAPSESERERADITAQPPEYASPLAELPASPADALIDYEIRLHTVDPIPGADVMALTEGQGGKSVRGWGYSHVANAWKEIAGWREDEYPEIAIALQLANRNGAVSEEQLMQLCEHAQQLAQRFNGVAECPETNRALRQASDLDLFCVDVDVLIGLNVVSRDNEVFSGARIAELAQHAGMILAVDGVYHLRNAAGEIVYSLCNHESAPFSVHATDSFVTHGVTLLFDLPRVADGLTAFDRMATLAQRIANELGGQLVDDNIRPLSQAGIDKIRAQIAQIYARMDERGIPGGSKRALRLFN